MRLGRILQDEQTMPFSDTHQLGHIGQTTVQMNGQQCTCATSNGRFDIGWTEVEAVRVGLDKYRNQTILGNSKNTGDVGIGGDYHLIPLTQHAKFLPGTQGEDQCIQTIGHANAMLHSTVLSEIRLEAAQRVTSDIPSRVDNTGTGRQQLVAILAVDRLQVQKFNHDSTS
ncbi:hypothetical protein D9M70_548820 [compost metagenome]